MINISFSIKYKTKQDEHIYICGFTPELGNGVESSAIPLFSEDRENWHLQISLPSEYRDFTYFYLVKDGLGFITTTEWRAKHRLLLSKEDQIISVPDSWIDRPKNSPFYTSAYYDVLFPHKNNTSKVIKRAYRESTQIVFQTYAPLVDSNQRVYLVGSHINLGSWDISKALTMEYIGAGLWYAIVNCDHNTNTHLLYKHFIADEMRQGILWESGENRAMYISSEQKEGLIYLNSLLFREDKLLPRFSGVVCPLFSLRHKDDFGVGDFGSLRLMVRWVHRVSLHVIQLLPINDTTFYRDWRDSYPYNAISVDAIHPIYIDLSKLSPLEDKRKATLFVRRANKLRKSKHLLYPEVLALKEEYLRIYVAEHAKYITKSKAYQAFLRKNKDWLRPYMAFCVLRDRNPQKSWRDWGEYSNYDKDKIETLLNSENDKEEGAYYAIVQYLLHDQLHSLSKYADKCGVLLKGDLPIGIAPNSVDAWTAPELFHLDRSAGAPPDDFALDGQNWGFPTYNWERMHEDGLTWWRHRLQRMSLYFKALRIDHILGFFRIWEIPRSQISGLLGHFSPALPYDLSFWFEQFRELRRPEFLTLPTIARSDAESYFKDNLSELISKGLLLDSGDYLHLAHGKQKLWADSISNEIPGGQHTIDCLVDLSREVALIEDLAQAGKYHPRIAFYQTKLFKSWPPELKERWQRISDDYFYHRHDELWKQTGLDRLTPLLQATDMLVCAEDLGMIPECVPQVLEQLEILSLDLERMPKQSNGTPWAQLHKLSHRSVCTTSTHDMPPLRAWWNNLNRETQAQYFVNQLRESRLSPESSLEDIYARIIASHLSTKSMLVILPIQDWMSIDSTLQIHTLEEEQINHPENPNQRWFYRLPIYIEDAETKYPKWINRIREMLQIMNRV